MVLVYSVKFSQEQSRQWMNSVLVAYVTDAFITEVGIISLQTAAIGFAHFSGLSGKIVGYLEKRKEKQRAERAKEIKRLANMARKERLAAARLQEQLAGGPPRASAARSKGAAAARPAPSPLAAEPIAEDKAEGSDEEFMV